MSRGGRGEVSHEAFKGSDSLLITVEACKLGGVNSKACLDMFDRGLTRGVEFYSAYSVLSNIIGMCLSRQCFGSERRLKVAENIDLSEMLKSYSNKWVALSADSSKVVGVADNPKGALEQAHLKKEQDPILTKTPENYGTFIL